MKNNGQQSHRIQGNNDMGNICFKFKPMYVIIDLEDRMTKVYNLKYDEVESKILIKCILDSFSEPSEESQGEIDERFLAPIYKSKFAVYKQSRSKPK